MSGSTSRKRIGGGGASGVKRKRRASADSDGDGDGPAGRHSDLEEDEYEDHDSAEDEQDDDEDEEEQVVQPSERASRPPTKKRKSAQATSSASRSAPAGSLADIGAGDSEGEDVQRTTGKRVILERPSVAFQRRKKEAKKAKREMKPGDVKGDSPTDTDANERKSVKILGGKAKAYAEVKKKAARSAMRAMDRSVVRRNHDFPPRGEDEFKHLIPKPQYDGYWNKKDQKDLEQRLSGDANFEKQCDPKTIVIGVWKTVFRFTGRLATDIIGPRTNLEFRSASRSGYAPRGNLPMWTNQFCEALPDIVLHPMFNLDTAKVALALQWAVICRTGDQRKYRLSGCKDDLFLRRLVSVIEKHQDDSTTPRYLRELALYEHKMIQDAGVGPPPWYELLRHIEKKAADTTHETAPQSGEVADGEPYFVNLADVYAVRSALDRMTHVSMRQWVGARLISGAVMPSREIGDVPNRELTQKAIKAVLLHQERNRERARRGGPPETLPSPRGDQERPSKDGVPQGPDSDGDHDIPDDDPFVEEEYEAAVPETPRGLRLRPRDRSPTHVGYNAYSRSPSPSLGEGSEAPRQPESGDLGADDGASSLDGDGMLMPNDGPAPAGPGTIGGSPGLGMGQPSGSDEEAVSDFNQGEGRSAAQETSASDVPDSSDEAPPAHPGSAGHGEAFTGARQTVFPCNPS